ncbi:glycosyltransferase [Vibrio vulnificus]|uniref:glycosyltransferase n=1 Tax=Vibrio vulnificus TaxID=672 RepID=UPI0005070D1C|nr:glycosyltransferase [Vibrio vulnificus]ELK8327532.1 glycosyltransferase family 4 protein [Vibrio vulnificus]ELN6895947.1 glycosyltransferase family 4 protein [Vibrio vulnificus]KFK56122.1 hypothetical protein JS86_06955 [Vibrio vulnificus]MCU8573842.1 glycosyltransferase family 4 protein [Vibrio vulnificus]HAS6050507.1 glycosyltransferase [Vibrio vulnificus]
MRAVFVHDHIFKKCKSNYYSEGKLTVKTWERYLEFSDHLTVIGRESTVLEKYADNYNLSSCDNVEFNCLSSFSIFDRLFPKEIDRFLLDKLSGADFIIVRLPSFLGTRAFYLARKLGIKTLVELVGCPFDSLRTHGSTLAWLAAPIEKLKLQNIMKVSRFSIYVTGGFLQKRYPTRGLFENISNVELVPLENFPICYKEKITRFAFIGSLTAKYKGLEDLLRALPKVSSSNVEVHILGGGNKQSYIDLARKLEIEHRVYFYSSIEGGQKVLEWLSQFDAYVQPSHTEGLPRALIEAMSVGLPCIGSNVGGIPELLPSMCVFKAKNVNELADKIDMLSNNPSLSYELAIKNRLKSSEYLLSRLSERRSKFLSDFFN